MRDASEILVATGLALGHHGNVASVGVSVGRLHDYHCSSRRIPCRVLLRRVGLGLVALLAVGRRVLWRWVTLGRWIALRRWIALCWWICIGRLLIDHDGGIVLTCLRHPYYLSPPLLHFSAGRFTGEP